MSGVTLKNVVKQFGAVKAVDNLSIEIQDKEFAVLVGPSGCGKTTALRMIAGLETVSSGEIYIGDTLVNDMAPKDRDIAMVFQNYALYPHMNIRDNMGFGLKIRQLSEGGDRRPGAGGRRHPRSQRSAGAKAQGTVRRPAAARGGGTGDRAQAEAVPVRRAALQSRRQAARRDARRDQQAASPSRRHHHLRHSRSGRGHDDGRPDLHHEQGRPAAERRADGGLLEAGQPLRRRLHRLAGDEFHRRNGGRGGRRPVHRRRRLPGQGARIVSSAARSRMPAGKSCSAFGPRISRRTIPRRERTTETR